MEPKWTEYLFNHKSLISLSIIFNKYGPIVKHKKLFVVIKIIHNYLNYNLYQYLHVGCMYLHVSCM